MKPLPRISDAEWEVMKVLWEKSPATANDVVERLRDATSWNPRTIKTLLNRLVGKKALGFEEDGRMYRYYPLVSEAECARAESRSFLNRVYGGALTPLIANFLQEKELSPEEIEELRRLLDQKGKG
ncbi:MAG: BlaI/MecI/CopY family transcriptional regulator [Candidatus Hydrogenedentes bacterium]|nr:BlaI/MecI/CopY family transcriptional regulator [Candidatus Hydrogenedentota bacterium]